MDCNCNVASQQIGARAGCVVRGRYRRLLAVNRVFSRRPFSFITGNRTCVVIVLDLLGNEDCSVVKF